MRTTRNFFAILALIFCLGFFATPAARADADGAAVYRKAVRGTVLIQYPDNGRYVDRGTGWVVDRERRLVITNHHVALNAATLKVLFPEFRDGEPVSERSYYTPGKAVTARVLDTAPARDLAVLQVERLPDGVEALPLAPRGARPGERLHLVGNPGAVAGAVWVYSNGTVRVVRHSRHPLSVPGATLSQVVDARVIESTVAGNPGDSGSAVVNDRGEVVGVHSSSKPGVALVEQHIDLSELKTYLAEVVRLLEPDTVTATDYLHRAGRHVVAGRPNRAVTDYGRAIALDKTLAAAWRERGLLEVRLGRFDQALADCDEAVRLAPEDGLAWNARGVVRTFRKDFAGAVPDFEKAVQRKPGDPQLLANLGLALRVTGKTAAALAALNKALALDPHHAQALRERGVCHYVQKKYDLAEKDLRLAEQVNPRDGWTFYWLGAVQEARGLAGAEYSYQRAVELDRSLESLTRVYRQRRVRVVNNTGKEITVSFRYQTLGKNNTWVWRPEGGSTETLQVVLKPGESRYLEDDGRIQADRIRLWAEAPGQTWPLNRDRDLVVCDRPYRLRNVGTYTFTFNP